MRLGGLMTLTFASAWEAIADAFPNRPATIADGNRTTWQQFEERAARLAQALSDHGITTDSKGGIYLHNSHEYQEAQFALFKVGACPINVNYRYKSDELVYLLDNADAEVVFFQSCYAMRIWEVKDRLPKVKLFVQIDDGTEILIKGAVDYERTIRQRAPLPRQAQNPDSLYMLYTGGTTGMPKGVMYPQGEFLQALLGIGFGAAGLELPTNVADYIALIKVIERPPITLPACPLMHGTGVWLGSFVPMMMGGTVVTTSKLGLNPDLLLSMIEQHRVSNLVIVGDAFAKPLLGAIEAAVKQGDPYRLDSLDQITSSGVMWSAETKQGLLEYLDVTLADFMGSTEGGMGSAVSSRDNPVETAQFVPNEGVRVISDSGAWIQPGSDEIGKVAATGLVPLGYYKDEAKTAETFKVIDGIRYSFPGDYATVAADGSITLLGRGSACINTAGEKVFPEEVEEVLKRHSAVFDALVVGLPDEQFGQRVVAVVSCDAGQILEEGDLLAFAKEHLAGYKVPKRTFFVAEVRRAPNGKADYKWAKQHAESQA